MDILFSSLSGYNFYSCNNEVYSIFNKKRTVVQHLKNARLFYLSELPELFSSAKERYRLKNIITFPTKLHSFFWPVDILSLENTADSQKYALVFPCRCLPAMKPLKEFFKNNVYSDWTFQKIIKLVVSILTAVDELSKSGYAYHEFSTSNIYFCEDDLSVAFDFSLSTQATNGDLFKATVVNRQRIMPEYADTLFYREERQSKMDLASDYYSIAVLIFKMIIGRLPYHGSVLDGIPDTSPREHEEWLELYHRHPVFIFDPHDDFNRIGDVEFGDEMKYAQRWNDLPMRLQEMFCSTFSENNALRKQNTLYFYSPSDWLSEFNMLI